MRAAVIAGGLVFALAGCSFFAATGPRPPPGPTKCNLKNTPFVADTIAAVGAAAVAGVASLQQGSSGDVVVPLGISGVFGVSSVYGYVQGNRCRAEYKKRPTWSLEMMPAVM
jgi:hypothetical protein